MSRRKNSIAKQIKSSEPFNTQWEKAFLGKLYPYAELSFIFIQLCMSVDFGKYDQKIIDMIRKAAVERKPQLLHDMAEVLEFAIKELETPPITKREITSEGKAVIRVKPRLSASTASPTELAVIEIVDRYKKWTQGDESYFNVVCDPERRAAEIEMFKRFPLAAGNVAEFIQEHYGHICKAENVRPVAEKYGLLLRPGKRGPKPKRSPTSHKAAPVKGKKPSR